MRFKQNSPNSNFLNLHESVGVPQNSAEIFNNLDENLQDSNEVLQGSRRIL